MQKLPDGVESTFRYILIASKRAEQLISGARPRLSSRHVKPTTIALAELNNGYVPWEPLTAEEYEQRREQELVAAEAEEQAEVVLPTLPPELPPAEVPVVEEPEAEAEEETDEFGDDIDDADFEEDLEDVEEDSEGDDSGTDDALGEEDEEEE